MARPIPSRRMSSSSASNSKSVFHSSVQPSSSVFLGSSLVLEGGVLKKKTIAAKKKDAPYHFQPPSSSSSSGSGGVAYGGIVKTVQPKQENLTDSFKSQVLEVLQCPVCHEGVKNTHLCSKCQQHYCRGCIFDWLETHSTCPNCRAPLTVKELVKYVRFDELQQTIKQFRLPECCQQHERQQLSLFCYPCEVCICVTCCFSELHVEHKEQIVPLDVAFKHYKQTLGESQDWIDGRKNEISEALDQAQKNVLLLTDEQDHVVQLYGQSAKLIAGEADVPTIRKMLETEKTITETRLQSELKKLPIPSSCEDYFISDPIKLTFRFTDFDQTMEEQSVLDAASLTSCGFLWSSQIVKDHGKFHCQLKLIHGKSSRYAITFEDQREKFQYVEVGKPVHLGVVDLEAVAAGDDFEVIVRVRQTYGDRCKQLQEYVAQLETDSTHNATIKRQIAEWWANGTPLFK